jgi:RNA polymerase sigma factor (sigma-70 family)
MKALPNYRYDPDRKGHFRNYLIGIIRHKAVSEIRRRQAEADCIDTYANNRVEHSDDDANADLDSLRKEIFEAAVDQLMADDRISSATREIFRHVVLMHEKPAQVAAEFGTTRNNVDQIKKRMIDRLSELVQSMNRPLSSP